ncbi:MAG: type II secretion system protein GspG [bacterium]|nr:type II secretion system protein GspG [bacterium]
MKKAFLVMFVVIIIAGGLYFLWIKPKLNPAVTPIQLTGSPAEKEQAIKNQLAQAEDDLRSLHIALDSWKVDNKTYPDTLFVLTTPIAYIVRIPTDPFTQNAVFNYKKLNDNDFIIWSIGPDGKNDNGQIVYDQNNGLTSSGDIIRRPKTN